MILPAASGLRQRRQSIHAIISAGLLASLGRAKIDDRRAIATRSAVAAPTRQRAVYHLSEAARVGFVLGNIRNHYDGTKGEADIVLVVHGPALEAFRHAKSSAAISSRFGGLVKSGLSPVACGNTLHFMDATVADLLDGFSVVEQGGVVRITELQAQGCAYLRP